MLGYPGSVSSTLQQAGRVGRQRSALVLMMLRDEPLEQWFARDSATFFASLDKPEMVKIPLSNPAKIAEHLACAGWELTEWFDGLSEEDAVRFFGPKAKDALRDLYDGNIIREFRKGVGKMYWKIRLYDGPSYDQLYRNIRIPIATGKFSVVDERGRLAGECDSHLVSRDLFPGAIWINNGRFYRSKSIDYREGTVSVEYLSDETDYYTYAMPRTTLMPGEDVKERKSKKAGLVVQTGTVEVTRQVKLYSEVPFSGKRDKQEVKTTRTRDMVYDSTATWFEFDLKYLGISELTDETLTAVHGAEHAIRTVFPLVADVDPGDVGSAIDWKKNEPVRLYMFDSFAGGTGLAEFSFEKPAELVKAAYKILSSCDCQDGCPRCLIVPWCEAKNENLDKRGAMRLLKQMEQDLR